MNTTKTCRKCQLTKSVDDFYRRTSSADGYTEYCKDCRREQRQGRTAEPGSHVLARRTSTTRTLVTDSGYVASRQLLALWSTVRVARSSSDAHPMNLLFLGPSGSGKTEAAKHLAAEAGLPFTKIDAAAMTDPESWFGTREVVSEGGVSVTTYRPSEFVVAISQPGVMLVDEVNRIRDEHRNIFLPLLDGTHSVTNPLTGEVVTKHPDLYVIMSGNRGLQFTGTYPIDPALMSRALTVKFDYLASGDEQRVAIERTGCDVETAAVFVRFANETRDRAKSDVDFTPVSTREVLAACLLVANGLAHDDAIEVAVMNGANDEGAEESVVHRMRNIWTGIRPSARPAPAIGADAWTDPLGPSITIGQPVTRLAR